MGIKSIVHTCSIFTCQHILWNREPWCIGTNYPFKFRDLNFSCVTWPSTVTVLISQKHFLKWKDLRGHHSWATVTPIKYERYLNWISSISSVIMIVHDDVIKWNHFPRYWPFVRGIHRSPVNSPHKGQWRGALMFALICASINDWVKQSWGWWFETPSLSLWRHRSGKIGVLNPTSGAHFTNTV